MYRKVLSLWFEYEVHEVGGENFATGWLRAVVLAFLGYYL